MKEYIEREAAIAWVSADIQETFTKMDVIDILHHEIPSADVAPVVHGTWEEMRDPYGKLTGWIHTRCGHETNAATEYCSTCGAKMTFVERKVRMDGDAHV